MHLLRAQTVLLRCTGFDEKLENLTSIFAVTMTSDNPAAGLCRVRIRRAVDFRGSLNQSLYPVPSKNCSLVLLSCLRRASIIS